MTETLASFGGWGWIILGLILMAVEILAPGLFLIWLGVAAVATGVLAGMFGLGWQAALLAFAALAVAAVAAGRAFFHRHDRATSVTSGLNAQARDLVGRTVTLEAPVENGVARVRIGDTVWRAIGSGLEAGQAVRIVRIEGSALMVEKA